VKVSYNSEKVGRGTKWSPDFVVKRSFQSNISKKVKKRERRKRGKPGEPKVEGGRK